MRRHDDAWGAAELTLAASFSLDRRWPGGRQRGGRRSALGNIPHLDGQSCGRVILEPDFRLPRHSRVIPEPNFRLPRHSRVIRETKSVTGCHSRVIRKANVGLPVTPE